MIVAIGGGELSEGQTSSIDTFVLQASGRPSPKVLFLPTASRDAPGYIATVESYFGARDCEVRALSLTANPSLRTITEAFGWVEVPTMAINPCRVWGWFPGIWSPTTGQEEGRRCPP